MTGWRLGCLCTLLCLVGAIWAPALMGWALAFGVLTLLAYHVQDERSE